MGLEKTFEEHIEKLVVGFREMRRILRDDGILWVNYGDKYTGGNSGGGSPDCKQRTNKGSLIEPVRVRSMPSGNLIGLAWRLALALQADGWVLRSDVVWAKAVSFNDVYSGSTMPESVSGTRWERCRVKVRGVQHSKMNRKSAKHDNPTVAGLNTRKYGEDEAQWQDCPGCPKCEKTGGYVLRRGSWRSTRAHEYVFQFVKQIPYYADMEAVREDFADERMGNPGVSKTGGNPNRNDGGIANNGQGWTRGAETGGRNIRDVWTINPQSYPDSHYATFPEKLVEPCIKVSTSQKGVCPKCGAQWARVIDSKQIKRKRPNDRTDRHNQDGMNSCGNTVAGTETTTLGWRPTCDCGCKETVPAIIYDCFAGSGTVAAVAAKLNRNYMGSELSENYIKQAQTRILQGETGLSKEEIENGQGALFSHTTL